MMTNFVIGMIIGTFVGVATTSLLVIGKREDEKMKELAGKKKE